MNEIQTYFKNGTLKDLLKKTIGIILAFSLAVLVNSYIIWLGMNV